MSKQLTDSELDSILAPKSSAISDDELESLLAPPKTSKEAKAALENAGLPITPQGVEEAKTQPGPQYNVTVPPVGATPPPIPPAPVEAAVPPLRQPSGITPTPSTQFGQRGAPPRAPRPESGTRGAPPPTPVAPLPAPKPFQDFNASPSLVSRLAEHLFPEQEPKIVAKFGPTAGINPTVYDMARRAAKMAGGVADWMMSPEALGAAAIEMASAGTATPFVATLLGAQFATQGGKQALKAAEDIRKNGINPENAEAFLQGLTIAEGGLIAPIGASAHAAGIETAKAKVSEIARSKDFIERAKYYAAQGAVEKETTRGPQSAFAPTTAEGVEALRKHDARQESEAQPNQAQRRATTKLPETTVQEQQYFTDQELEELTRPEPDTQLNTRIPTEIPGSIPPSEPETPVSIPEAIREPETPHVAPQTTSEAPVEPRAVQEPERVATPQPAAAVKPLAPTDAEEPDIRVRRGPAEGSYDNDAELVRDRLSDPTLYDKGLDFDMGEGPRYRAIPLGGSRVSGEMGADVPREYVPVVLDALRKHAGFDNARVDPTDKAGMMIIWGEDAPRGPSNIEAARKYGYKVGPESTLQSFHDDLGVLRSHEARGGAEGWPTTSQKDFEKRLGEVADNQRKMAVNPDYLDKLRSAAETHFPDALPTIEKAEDKLLAGNKKEFAVLAEKARADMRKEYGRQLAKSEAEKYGLELPEEPKPTRTPRTPEAEPPPATPKEAAIRDGARSEMDAWLEAYDSVRQQQPRGESASTLESNVEGKELEELQNKKRNAIPEDDRASVKKNSPVSDFKDAPGEIAEAMRKKSGKLYEKVVQAFREDYESHYGAAMDAELASQLAEDLFSEDTEPHTFEEGKTESGLGRTEEEGMRKLVGGRPIEQLKEGKSFDQERLAKSELFAGKDQAQGTLPTGEGRGEAFEEEGGDTSLDFSKPAVQMRSLQELGQGTSDASRAVKDAVRQTFVPSSRGSAATTMGLIVRRGAADLAARNMRAEHELRAARRYFSGRTEAQQLGFIHAVETGEMEGLPPREQGFARTMRTTLDATWADVRRRSGIQSVIENYFPHLWADPEKAAQVMRKFYGRRPLEGGKGFFKERKLMTVQEGIEAGLELAVKNPVDLVLAQLHQENKFITGHDMVEEMKKLGVIQFRSVFDKRRGGEAMAKIDDPIGTVYGKPTVTVKEAYDEIMFDQLNGFARSLGIQHFRQVNIGKHADGWGYTKEGTDKVFTKVGGPESILTHEIGHQLDYRYGLKDRLTRSGETAKELRALADLRYAGHEDLVDDAYKQYARKGSEKIANLIHAMIHAPELAEKVAPQSVQAVRELAMMNPELKPLLDVKPSLVIGSQEYETPVGGLVTKGHWWAPEPAARVINNYLGPGLGGSKNALVRGTFNVMRATGNILNQAQLGASAFHFTFTALDSASSMFSSGLQDLATGKVRRGALKIAGGNLGVAPWYTAIEGSKVLKEFYRPGSQGEYYGKVANDLITAGGRAGMEFIYKNNAVNKFFDAWGKKDYIGAGYRAVPAALETLAKPIMEYWVPRQKLGAFAMLSQQMLEGLGPEADPMVVRKTLARAWDAVDDRMGQVVYDNLFWSRATKDAGMIAVRSLGWNIGTWRHFGGAAVDLAQAARGKGAAFDSGSFRLTPRMAYTLAFPAVVALHGAMAMYLMTGKGPQELKDYFFPQTGKMTPTGEPERVSLPSYAKDAYAYFHDFPTSTIDTLGHKLHPDLAVISEMLKNKDFYGTEIRHEDDPLVQQFKDAMDYLGKQYIPFSGRNLAQRLGSQTIGETAREAVKQPGTAAASFFGIVPAPKSLEQTPAERLAQKYAGAAQSQGGRTKAQFERAQARNAITKAFQAKDPTAASQLSAALKAGTLAPSDIRVIAENRNKAPLQRYLRSASLEQLLNVWDKADPEEKRQLRPMIATRRSSQTLTAEERAVLLPRANRALAEK